MTIDIHKTVRVELTLFEITEILQKMHPNDFQKVLKDSNMLEGVLISRECAEHIRGILNPKTDTWVSPGFTENLFNELEQALSQAKDE